MDTAYRTNGFGVSSQTPRGCEEFCCSWNCLWDDTWRLGCQIIGLVIDKESGSVDYMNPEAKRYYGVSMDTKKSTDQPQLDLAGILETCDFESGAERAAIEESLREIKLESNTVQFECRKVSNGTDTVRHTPRSFFCAERGA